MPDEEIIENNARRKYLQQLSPFVYWAQTARHINLKVDLKDAQWTDLKFTPTNLEFKSKGVGARGLNEYEFDIKFYGLIDDEQCSYKVFDNKIECLIVKSESGWWTRLIATPQKPHWLKIDFDRWQTEDDLEDEERPRNVQEDYSREYHRLQKEEMGYIKESSKNVYMVIYNLAQFVGFLYVLSVLSVLYYRDGATMIPQTYALVGNAMKFLQLLQYLEVLHPIFGYTKGSPVVPFMQVSGRNFVLFFMIEFEERMQTKPVIFYVFVIWSLVEVIRYPYYISQILKMESGFLTWLRYTVWIPLYPLGILCEGIIILRNIPYFEETKRFSIEMPNKWNISFDMPTFLKIYLILLILPGSFFLMSHMAGTRAKKLNSRRRSRKSSE
ncbi:very-long-chain (3R)-3-hydroxyacyl-CoA dehydratase [Stomoxys calcitrans]|uniref:very-long-chain (3R)-3-hydroxyacyl-CoA dehydratase n=1 Tax=Stomoxys calcitrans TaxID=35570 RepID=UPI0027E2C67F|nr:very-long-chain (3R)-3-hydroxyacyl-CoA dehydratase [Stomoxys calcitrans]